MKNFTYVLFIGTLMVTIFVGIAITIDKSVARPITQLSEYCRDGKNVITYGHRKMWEINPKTNQLIKCDD